MRAGGLIEVFDDFDHRRRIESAEPTVPIHQRTVHKANALTLLWSQPIELETRFRQIKHSARHIHANDLCELVIGQETTQELALAASQIEHTRSARIFRDIQDGVETTFVETDGPLDRRFLLVLLGRNSLLFGLFLRRQPRDGITNEPSLVHEISRDDNVARWMAVEPSSGLRSHRPPSAELNQRERTTGSSDEATYGRSLTY